MGFIDFFKPSDNTTEKIPDNTKRLSEKVNLNKPFPNAKVSAWGKPVSEQLVNKNGKLKNSVFTAGYEKIEGDKAIIKDSGIYFYRVVKGDSIQKIKHTLANFRPEFAYLIDPANSDNKNTSFNIPNESLRIGEWIPIPKKTRELNDKQFANYCFEAIKLMEINLEYGTKIKELVDQIGEDELIATMIAIAKQESGGKPLGQFVFHRWEPTKKTFSFSILHVMDRGAGIIARRKLGLSKGQLYHPQNAARLFLAFLIEKTKPMRKKPSNYLPLSKNLEKFVAFYNGKKWKNFNPNYANKLNHYYKEAIAMLNGKELPPKPFFYVIGNKSLRNAIKEANTLNTREYPNKNLNSMLVIDANIERVADALEKSIDRYYGSKIIPSDEIALWINDQGRTYLMHRRKGNKIDIRIKPDIYPLGKS